MQKIIYICDKCHKELDVDVADDGIQLCPQCSIELDKWLRGELVLMAPMSEADKAKVCKRLKDEIRKEVMAEFESNGYEQKPTQHLSHTPKIAIDKPKVKALLAAGWTIRNIADEIGVSYATMWRTCNEIKAEAQS